MLRSCRSAIDHHKAITRAPSVFELHNINVFLGGFAGALELREVETFDDYLAKVAPFSTEAELRKYLEMRGVVVEEHTLKNWVLPAGSRLR